MKLAFPSAALLALVSSTALAADTYTVDPGHSEVGFRVRHLVSRVAGRFNSFSGTILMDAANPAASSVEFAVKVHSIDTGNADRDGHLKSPDFFDAAKFPEITFKSSKVEAAGKDVYKVTGNLTMKGVTKEIVLPVTFVGETKFGEGVIMGGFETATKLNRKDYGISWNKTLDSGGFVLGEDVEVTINLEVKKHLAAAAAPAPVKK